MVIDYPRQPAHEIERLLARCRDALDQVSPSFGASGSRLLEAHPPQQWPVEWHLPWWLAQELRLSDAVWRELTVCNLLGLGYVRLQDHLVEQTTAGGLSPGPQAVLAGAFYEAALAGLSAMFAGMPAFWQRRRTFMAQWLAALAEDAVPLHGPGDQWPEQDVLRLAARGAPLKVTAAGACLLAGRPEAIPSLERVLDHLLTAQVLLDHLDDWRDDVQAGRFNVFVAYAANGSQSLASEDRAAAVRSVLALLMTGDPAGYLGHIQRHAARARALAAALPCAGLADFIAALEVEAQVGYEVLIGSARTQLAGAVASVLQR
jgi:hypothetical protein